MTTAPLTDERCPSCGGTIALNCCEICGERRPSERIYTLREFASETFEVLTNVERSFLKTVWTLVRRPGELSAAYMRGERVSYLRPLQLFILVSVVYFVWAGWTGLGVFNTKFADHIEHESFTPIVEPIAMRHVEAARVTIREYGARFDAKSLVLARSAIVLMVPMFAVVLAAVTFRRRRPIPAVQHVVFSLHFFTVLLLLAMATTFIATTTIQLVVVVSGMLAYLIPALRVAYRESGWAAALEGVVLVIAFAYVLDAFRFLLFFLTIWQL